MPPLGYLSVGMNERKSDSLGSSLRPIILNDST